MNTTPNAPTLTADDIPMEFTLDGLRQHFSDEEIVAMNDGDDPILPGVDLAAGAPDAEALPEGEDASAVGTEDEAPQVEAPAVTTTAMDAPDPERPIPVDTSSYAQNIERLDAKPRCRNCPHAPSSGLTTCRW